MALVYIDTIITLNKVSINWLDIDSTQASTHTQNVTGPVGPVKPRIYLSCKIFTGLTNFCLHINITIKIIA